MVKVISGYEFPDDAKPSEINAFIRRQEAQKKSNTSDTNQPYNPPIREEMSGGDYASGLAKSALSGLTFNFSDEALAGLKSLGGTPYEQALEEERSQQKKFKEQYPVAALGSEIAGSLPTMLIPGLGPAKGLQFASRVGKLAEPFVQAGIVGAKQGALSGMGESEGDIADRAAGAARGAGVGAVTGGALTGAGRIASPILGAVAERVLPSVSSQVALSKVLEDLQRSGMSPDQARQKLLDMQATGAPAQLFDVAPSLTSRAEAIAQKPSQGAEGIISDIEQRQAGQRDRIMSSAQKQLGASADYYGSEEAIKKQLQKNADPFYKSAYQAEIPFEAQAELQTIMDSVNKAFPSAQNYAKRLMAADQQEARRTGTQLVDTGSGIPMKTFEEIPQVQQWDYIMRGLHQAGRSQPAGSDMQRAAYNLRREIGNVLDTHVEDFAKARSIYKGDKEVQDALESGKSFFREDPELLARNFPNMSDAEKQAYRIGALKSMRDKLYGSGDTTDATKRIGQSIQNRRDAINTIMPDDASNNIFQSLLENEAKLVKNANRITGGSATARRLEAGKDLASDDFGMLGVAADVASGSPSRLFNRVTSILAKSPVVPEARANAIAKILRVGSPAEIDSAVSALENFAAKQEADRARKAFLEPTISGITGKVAAERMTQQSKAPPPYNLGYTYGD
jgi:hypothetical protein